jgi:hypothetical protein
MRRNELAGLGAIACLLLALASGPARSATILVSSSFSNQPSPSVSTAIWIEGLGDHAPPSLGAFDLTLAFDTAVLQLDRVTFGADLGSPDQRILDNDAGTLVPVAFGSGEALAGGTLDAGGSVRLDEISLLEASAGTCLFCVGPYLEDLQPSRFVLAAIGFAGLVELPNANRERLGLTLTVNALSDAFGNPIEASVEYLPAPAPGTPLLLAAALLGLVAVRWPRHPGRAGQASPPRTPSARQ